ncbi:uncharacterized protein [Primulina eburnea]|uniref:uncharacterized protein n=1 Tax=Primulina eburnea TaxID=1245227 RepID=UPI003C6BFC32
MKELAQKDHPDKFSVASDGSFHFNWRLVVLNLIDMNEVILCEAHCSRHSIHPGNQKMYHTLRAYYWWEVMKKEIFDFMAKCLTCQRVKAERTRHGANFIPYDRPCTYKKMAKLYIDHVSLSVIRDVFYVSMLLKYEPDPSHVLSTEDVEFDSSLSYIDHPIQILDRKEKQIGNKTIPLVLVQWSTHGIKEVTWELEARMRQEWPQLFKNIMNNSMYLDFPMYYYWYSF